MFNKKNVSLKKYSFFKIGGKADSLVTIKNKKELIQTIKEIRKKNQRFFVLGGGSNILFDDENFKGVVLKIETSGISINKNFVTVESGTRLSKIVSFCLINGLSGLEWTAGIPGTVGGAIKGNAGAFKKSMQDSIVSVEVYDFEKDKIKVFKNKDCEFNYRESLFKKKNRYVIIEAKIKLKKAEKSSIEKKIKLYLRKRKQKQPQGFSAGSVFKNYKIKNKKEKQVFLKNYPELKEIIKDDFIPAAFLIEQCGLKGKKVGEAMVSKVHANFIINIGRAKSKDVKKLMNVIKKEVKKTFKIMLEEEIIVVSS